MIEPFARLGYSSKAVIYFTTGLLAVAAATGQGGRVTDTSGALRELLSRPFGHIILVALGIGLCGYAIWRFLDAWIDPDRHGTSVGGLVTRIGNVVRGVVYGALGVEAFRLSQGLKGSAPDDMERWTGRFMELPMGTWLVGLTGLIILAYGVSQILATMKPLDKMIDVSILPPRCRNGLVRVSRFGVGARGVLITAIGAFLVRAALMENPNEARGTRESVLALITEFGGRWILLAIAAGLLAYAVDQAVHARCRRITPVM